MSSPDDTIPTITLGGRTFSVPEFSIKAQRKVTPALVKCSRIAEQMDEEGFGLMLDTVFLCLTIEAETPITKDEFEALRIKALDLSGAIKTLLEQAGLKKAGTPDAQGGAGGAAPETPLNGETTLTT